MAGSKRISVIFRSLTKIYTEVEDSSRTVCVRQKMNCDAKTGEDDIH